MNTYSKVINHSAAIPAVERATGSAPAVGRIQAGANIRSLMYGILWKTPIAKEHAFKGVASKADRKITSVTAIPVM